MSTLWCYRICLPALLALLTGVSDAAPAASSSTQQDLKQLSTQIRSAQKELKQARTQKESEEQQLRRTEQAIGRLESELGSVETRLGSSERELLSLEQKQEQLARQRDQQMQQLKVDMRFAARNQQQAYFKLLLNQQHPEKFSRLLKYHEFNNRAQASRIQEFSETLRQIKAIADARVNESQQLAQLRSSLSDKKQHLAEARQERAAAIAHWNTRISSKDGELAGLLKDQQKLQSLLAELARKAEEEKRRKPARTEPRVPEKGHSESERRALAAVPAAKGACALPLNGSVAASYGSARSAGLNWTGTLLRSAAGTPVRAIADGEVAFADWMRGYGNLLILNHGNGLFSLYGYNQSLLKAVRERVRAGDSVATVGVSGGNDKPGLFFGIQLHGQARDPMQWCRLKPL